MSRIYDSSAITQRRRDQAQAGSFINRIQNPNNPQTSYGPLQGNYDASIMNSVKMGQPKEFYRNSGCVIISNGCPCPPIVVDEIVSGPVILAPGSVSNIQVQYGSVIVTWDAPTTGGVPTSYTVSAIPSSGSTVTVTGVLTTTYSFATGDLIAGTVYEMSVIGVNAAGNGSLPASRSSPISGPYVAPESTNESSFFFPDRIDIRVTPYTVFTPTKYILKTYTNDVLTSTSSPTNYSSDLIVVSSGLSCLNVYSFQVQLLNDSNQYSSFGVKDANIPVYPFGPTINSISNITATTAQVNYTNYTTTNGFDLTTGDAECIINSVPAISYTNLTNISLILTGLTPGTFYSVRSIVITFRKTINGNVINSSPSSLLPFTTNSIVPGAVTNVQAEYGSVNVTWNAPTTGGTPTSYTLFADDQITPGNSVTITGITTTNYTFPTYTGPATNQLTAGDQYLFRVSAVNAAGSGTAGVSSAFYAPYIAPVSINISARVDPNTIFINIDLYTEFTATKYILKTYTNDVLSSTSSPINYPVTSQIVINSGLSCLNVYTFELQVLNDSNQYSSFGIKDPNIPVFPSGPTITSVSNITATTVQVNYTNYTTNGFDLTTGGAECIINNPPTTDYGYNTLTNTSVILTGFTPLDTYTTIVIAFRKTINGFVINSDISFVPSFTTHGIAPVVTSSDAPTANNATILFNPYSSTSGTPGQFDFTGATFSIPGASPTIESITQPSEIYIGSLSPATTYNGCRMTLTGSGGAISDPSNTFTIVTKSFAPTSVQQISSTQTTSTCTFGSYSGFTGTITQIIAYDTSSGVPPYTTTYSVTIISQTEFIISGLLESTSYTVGITVSNGTYTSMISDSFSVSTAGPPPPLPDAPAGIDAPVSSQGFTTQGITFVTYTEPLISAVVFNGNTGIPYGTVTNLTNSSLTITGLDQGVEYLMSTVQVKVSNVSGESPPSNVPYFSTLSAPGPPANVQLGATSYNTQDITFDSYAVTLISASISGGYGNTNLTQSGLTITGLTAQTFYSGLTVDVTNGGGTSGTSTIPDFTTSSYPNPNGATYTGTYDSGSATVTATIHYNRYTAFTPTSGTLFNNSGTQLGSFSTVTDIALVITGVPIDLSDTGCYITLTDGSFTTSNSNTFVVGTFIVTGALQGGSGSSNPYSNPITINYVVGSSFNPFSTNSGTITIPPQTVILSVTSPDGGIFIIDGVNNPVLNFVRGNIYILNINAPGHPFYFQTSGLSYNSSLVYTDGITGSGTTNGTIIFEVPHNAPSTLTYVCQIHSNMGNSVNISTVPGTFSLESVNNTQAFFNTSLRGTYSNCSIILVDTSSVPTLPSNTFTIEITD